MRARVLVVDVVAVHGDRVAGLPRPAPPSRPAARRRRRRCRRRGTAGRGGRPTRSRARVAGGTRTSGSGSKIDVQTVLKLIDDAITATSASSGASSGNGTSSRWSDFRGSFSSDGTPGEHLLLVGPHHRTAVRDGERERRRAPRPWRPGEDRVPDGGDLPSHGGPTVPSSGRLRSLSLGGFRHARFRHRLVRPHSHRQALRRAGRRSSATDLGGHAIAAALERAGISGDQVDYVLLGQVLQAGAGQMPARQAAVKGGIPLTVPSMTVNKVCLSGIDAIYLADQMIQAGDAEVVVAGGMESMTKAPYLLKKARDGLPDGQRRAARLDDRRRPVVRVRRRPHGRGHRALHGRAWVASRARCRTTSRRRATSAPRPP